MSDDKHKARMVSKKAVMDAKIANATEERGVLILLKGNGKGKSSSAFGTMARSVGHGKKCAVIQFIKGRSETGEYKLFRDHDLIDWHVMGHGFTWETQDKQQDISAAKKAWALAETLLQDDRYDMLVFDELSYMFKYELWGLPHLHSRYTKLLKYCTNLIKQVLPPKRELKEKIHKLWLR